VKVLLFSPNTKNTKEKTAKGVKMETGPTALKTNSIIKIIEIRIYHGLFSQDMQALLLGPLKTKHLLKIRTLRIRSARFLGS